MKNLLLFIIVLVCAFVIAILLHQASFGHVIIFWGHYRIDASLITAILLVLILIYLLKIIISIRNIPLFIENTLQKFVLKRRRHYLEIAMLSFFAGEYSKSYKRALRVIDTKKSSKESFLALCIAISSAQKLENNQALLWYPELDKYMQPKYLKVKDFLLNNTRTHEELGI